MKYLNIDTSIKGRILEGRYVDGHLNIGDRTLSAEDAGRMLALGQLVPVPPAGSHEWKMLNLWRRRGLHTLNDEGSGVAVGLNYAVPTLDELRAAVDEAEQDAGEGNTISGKISRAWLALADEEILWFARCLHYCMTTFVVPAFLEDFGADVEGEVSVRRRAEEIWTQEVLQWAREVEAVLLQKS